MKEAQEAKVQRTGAGNSVYRFLGPICSGMAIQARVNSDVETEILLGNAVRRFLKLGHPDPVLTVPLFAWGTCIL